MEKEPWWSGKLYKRLIDPLNTDVRRIIADFVPEKSTVLDIACGTGALAMQLASKCQKVVGIDLSQKMIDLAKKSQEAAHLLNVDFQVADATQLSNFSDQSFDVVTISLFLHEIPTELAVQILKEARRIGKTIIIADYTNKAPTVISAIATHVIERLAGKGHFDCFQDFKKQGGLDSIIEKVGLKKTLDHINETETVRVLQLCAA